MFSPNFFLNRIKTKWLKRGGRDFLLVWINNFINVIIYKYCISVYFTNINRYSFLSNHFYSKDYLYYSLKFYKKSKKYILRNRNAYIKRLLPLLNTPLFIFKAHTFFLIIYIFIHNKKFGVKSRWPGYMKNLPIIEYIKFLRKEKRFKVMKTKKMRRLKFSLQVIKKQKEKNMFSLLRKSCVNYGLKKNNLKNNLKAMILKKSSIIYSLKKSKVENKFILNLIYVTLKKIFKLITFFTKTHRKTVIISKKLLLPKIKKKPASKNKGVCHVTFSRRNMFLVLSKQDNILLHSTTLRKEGFLGRRRQQYVSVYDTVRVIKKIMRKFKISYICLIYNGWNRFKVAVKNSFKSKYYHKVKIVYIKFLYSLPHNGCRATKRRRKKRKKRRWLKPKRWFKKKHWFKKKVKLRQKRWFKKNRLNKSKAKNLH